jgi:AcrR family transcriptional regulator
MPAEQRRAQLLDVARDAFARSGYRGTTALEIGRQAGVSEKLVLKHFGSKEGLYRAAVIEPLLELLETSNTEARRRMASGTVESAEVAFFRVHAFLVTWARLVSERAPLLLSFAAELHEFPDATERIAALIADQVDQSVEIFEEATAGPEFRRFDRRVAIESALGAATVAGLTRTDPEPFLEEFLKLTLFGALRRAPERRQ